MSVTNRKIVLKRLLCCSLLKSLDLQLIVFTFYQLDLFSMSRKKLTIPYIQSQEFYLTQL